MPELATILIVEDLPDDALLLRHALKRAGIRNPIQEVPHGRVAVDYLLGVGQFANRAAFPLPALIIAGYRVSPLGGVELIEWMQQQPQFRDIPVAILSGIGSEQDMARAYAA